MLYKHDSNSVNKLFELYYFNMEVEINIVKIIRD